MSPHHRPIKVSAVRAFFVLPSLAANNAVAAKAIMKKARIIVSPQSGLGLPSLPLNNHDLNVNFTTAAQSNTTTSNANFNTPASSPAFNYAFRRGNDTIKLGVNFYFGAAPAPASPAYPVKAPALK